MKRVFAYEKKPIIDAKVCWRCGVLKLLKEFHRNISNKDGRASACAKCKCEIQREWRSKHPLYQKKYKQAHPLQFKRYYRKQLKERQNLEYKRKKSIYNRKYREKKKIKEALK